MPTTAEDVSPAEQDPGAALSAQRLAVPRWGIKVGPLGHLRAERERLDGLRWNHFDVHRMAPTIGARISGVDLTQDLADPVVAELREALVNYKVLFFAEQPMTPGQHVAFARRFGALEVHPFIPANAEHPELVRFEKSAEVGGYENSWHSDVSWRQTPSMGAVLHAIDVPQTGGDTLFADMYAAYDGLDELTKARLEGLSATHDFMLAFAGQVTPAERDAMRRTYPPARHPVVRTHEETGRKLIYVNRIFTDRIEGLGEEESTALIELLSRQAETVEYQCRWTWEPHSVAFWDNRAVQHYACSDYWPATRVMERASIVGERPV
jgi:alpha-ketoglutarate-dependent taurine dioxygenase